MLFDRVLTRTDPERAHHAGVPAPSGRRAGPRAGRRPAAHGRRAAPVRAMGLDFPGLLGPRGRLRQERRRHRRAGRLGFALRRDRHRDRGAAARQPAGRGCPGCPADRAVVNRMGFNNDGAEVVARRLAVAPASTAPAGAAGVPLGINIGKTKVVPEDDAVARLREERRAARAVRRLPGGQRLLAQHPGPARPAGRRAARAAAAGRPPARRRGARRPARAAAGQDRARPGATTTCSRWPTWPSALGLDGIVATNTTISRDGLRSAAEQVEPPPATGGLSGAAAVRPRADRGDALLRGRVGDRT